MVDNRKDEAVTGTKFRTERMFQEGDYWFFYTREGSIEGPFRDLLEARTRLEAYIRLTNSGLAPTDGKFSLTKQGA